MACLYASTKSLGVIIFILQIKEFFYSISFFNSHVFFGLHDAHCLQNDLQQPQAFIEQLYLC